MEPIEGSETSAFRTQTPGNYPKRKHTTEILYHENFNFVDCHNATNFSCQLAKKLVITDVEYALSMTVKHNNLIVFNQYYMFRFNEPTSGIELQIFKNLL